MKNFNFNEPVRYNGKVYYFHCYGWGGKVMLSENRYEYGVSTKYIGVYYSSLDKVGGGA